ncbi:MAG: hypothetical protein DRP97_00560 [Candidatus Latescibacterota bacterium]|nr:MAG: hypothetical protein DRP97_00560 [Candidatus Latescibacterota bacterium]
MTKLYFDCRDLLRAVRLGWSGKKIGLSFSGLIIAYLGYAILTYVALLAGGQSFGAIWGTYGLYPWVCGSGVPWYSWVIYVAGILFAIVVLFRYATAVARISYRQLKGDDFYSMGDARNYVKKNWKATIFSPLALLGMMAFLILCGALIGLLARIPYVGELAFSLGLPLIFAVSLFVVFLWVVFIVSLVLAPAIVGITGEDTLETVIQLFSTVWSQPWRLVLYEILLKIYAVLATAILGIFSFKAAQLIHWACGLWMGEKMDSIIQVAVRLLHAQCPVPGGFIGGTPAGVGGTLLVSGWIAGIMMVLLAFFILSYSFSICCAGQTLIYLILRQKKDDENLLEKKDQEEEEEEREREEEERKLEEEKKQAEKVEEKEEVKGEEVKEEASEEKAEAAPGAAEKPEEEKE